MEGIFHFNRVFFESVPDNIFEENKKIFQKYSRNEWFSGEVGRMENRYRIIIGIQKKLFGYAPSVQGWIYGSVISKIERNNYDIWIVEYIKQASCPTPIVENHVLSVVDSAGIIQYQGPISDFIGINSNVNLERLENGNIRIKFEYEGHEIIDSFTPEEFIKEFYDNNLVPRRLSNLAREIKDLFDYKINEEAYNIVKNNYSNIIESPENLKRIFDEWVRNDSEIVRGMKKNALAIQLYYFLHRNRETNGKTVKLIEEKSGISLAEFWRVEETIRNTNIIDYKCLGKPKQMIIQTIKRAIEK